MLGHLKMFMRIGFGRRTMDSEGLLEPIEQLIALWNARQRLQWKVA